MSYRRLIDASIRRLLDIYKIWSFPHDPIGNFVFFLPALRLERAQHLGPEKAQYLGPEKAQYLGPEKAQHVGPEKAQPTSGACADPVSKLKKNLRSFYRSA